MIAVRLISVTVAVCRDVGDFGNSGVSFIFYAGTFFIIEISIVFSMSESVYLFSQLNGWHDCINLSGAV
jgi:hypothetical protein